MANKLVAINEYRPKLKLRPSVGIKEITGYIGPHGIE